MDKEIETLLEMVKSANRKPFWQSTPQEARSGPMLMALLFGDAPSVERDESFTIPSSGGFDLPVRLYVPSANPKGLIVYFHGGGWVIGTVAGYHPFTATLANRTGCAVLSVDYRLAPEHAFPLPVDDALAAIRWRQRPSATSRLCWWPWATAQGATWPPWHRACTMPRRLLAGWTCRCWPTP